MLRNTQFGKTLEPVAKHRLADHRFKTSKEAKESGLIQTSSFSTTSIKHSSKASKLVTKLLLAHSPSKPSETIGVYNCLLSKSGRTQSSKTAETSFISLKMKERIKFFDLSSPGKTIVVGMVRSLFTHQRSSHWAAAMTIGRLILGLRHSILSSVMVFLVSLM